MASSVYVIENLDCAGCAAKIEAQLNAHPKVEKAVITFATRQLHLTAEDPDALLSELQQIARTVESGVEFHPRDGRPTEHREGCESGRCALDHDHHHGHDHVHLADPDDTSHGDHSGYETGVERVTILEDIFSENDHRAEHNRELLAEHGVEAINLMSSPGSGKTALLEKTLAAAQGKLRVGIIEGDIETALDADRLEGYGAQISLLNTGNGFGGECHLDAPMVSRALEGLDLSTLDLVMIENVGNLVCPAELRSVRLARQWSTPSPRGRISRSSTR